MLHPDQQLNTKIFDFEAERVSMRVGFGEGLVLAAKHDKNVVALCADLTESTHMKAFKQAFPDRYIEIGVAEQNMAAVASGMAAMGKVPVIGSFAIFSPGRNWEQIRTTICYNDRPVKIVGSHAGLNVGADGGSHQALEDIALMRVLPRMVVISPCDSIQAKRVVIAAAKTTDPTYIRLSREKTPIITTDETSFDIGKAVILTKHQDENYDAAIIATGPLVFESLLVAKSFYDSGKKIAVMNLSTIKPLDEAAVIRLAHRARAIVTVEDHQIYGGMGSVVAECLAKHHPVPIEFVGVNDRFGQSGKAEELMKLYGMDEKAITGAVNRVILRKK